MLKLNVLMIIKMFGQALYSDSQLRVKEEKALLEAVKSQVLKKRQLELCMLTKVGTLYGKKYNKR